MQLLVYYICLKHFFNGQIWKMWILYKFQSATEFRDISDTKNWETERCNWIAVDSVSDFGVLLCSFNFRDDPWISLPFQTSITHSSSDSLASQRCKWCQERIGFSQAVYPQMSFHVPGVSITKLTSDLPPSILRWCMLRTVSYGYPVL